MKPLSLSPALRWIFSVSIVGAVGFFITKTLAGHWQNLSGYDLSPNAASIAGTALFVVAVPASGWLWAGILERLSGHPINRTEAVMVQISSWLLKYIPGQVGSYGAKLAWGIKRGYSKKVITVSFIYENIFLVTSSVLTTVPIITLLFLEVVEAKLDILLPVLVTIPLLIFSSQRVFRWSINLALRLAGRKNQMLEAEDFLNFGELARQQLKFILPRLLNAIGFVLIAGSIVSVSPSQYLGLGAIYVLAGIIGILALFVPSGIGVREGIIILFASLYFPVETATLIALLARFYATAADVVLAIVYSLLKNRLKGAA